VTLDDGTADRKTYPHAVPFRRVKRIEESPPIFLADANADIPDGQA
jgi:hypothetical protein